MKKITGNNVDLYRQSIVKRIRKLIRKANRWRFFEKGNLSGILALITAVSSCFVWIPGVLGSVFTGLTLASIITFINVGIARIFVHKYMDIKNEIYETYQQLFAYDKIEDEKTIGFNYLTQTEISRNHCSSKEEYIARKSDDHIL